MWHQLQNSVPIFLQTKVPPNAENKIGFKTTISNPNRETSTAERSTYFATNAGKGLQQRPHGSARWLHCTNKTPIWQLLSGPNLTDE